MNEEDIVKFVFQGMLGVGHIVSSLSDAIDRLKAEGARFDLIFLDPPYRMTDMREVFAALERLTAPDGLVILEHEAKTESVTGDLFEKTDERKWGYCGISFFRRK